MPETTTAMTPMFPTEVGKTTPEKTGKTTPRETRQAPPPLPEVKPPGDPIKEIVGALCDPLIVFPGTGWEETIPQHLKDRLPLDRLAHNMMCLNGKARWDEACDLEALLYMYPLTLAHPISERWTRIYLYLGTKVMGDKTPGDIRHDTLSDYDMGELRGLKRWIRLQKLKARKERQAGKKAEAKRQVVAAKPEQFKMF